MSRFLILDTPIAGLKIVERQPIGDKRGYLARLFCAEEMRAAEWYKQIAQVNHTLTQKQGTVRGLHFQYPPHSEMKLVSCVRGAVWDVAVDLRQGSATFLQWHAQELSASNCRGLLLPEGFAHGFQTLSDDCELIYMHSNSFNQDSEAGLNPKDNILSISWPLAISELSPRDANFPMLDFKFKGVIF
jgi:dTDP-4-dehydrorhamnose 3,5-epimerase